MDEGMEAVLDAPEIDSGAEEVETGTELVEEGAEQVESAENAATGQTDPYTTKFSREFRAATKAWEAASPEAAKFAKQARDNHARLYALTQLEPKGIEGVRERYALLDGLTHGEVKGPEALAKLQEEYHKVAEVDAQIAKGDKTALNSFGPEFNAGLAKLAPHILSRIAAADPKAHEAIMLPEHVSFLSKSPLLKDFNDLIDVLNTQNDPRFDDKTKMQFAFQKLTDMGKWLNGIGEKAGQVSTPQENPEQSEFEQERTKFEQEKQQAHWETKIYPAVRKSAEDKFTEQLAPYQKRLNLSPTQTKAAMADFKSKLAKLMDGNTDYTRQYNAYRGQKSPDAGTVTNFVKIHIAKAAKEAFDQVKAERWEAFLAGKPKPATPVVAAAGKATGPVPPNVEIRTVKPPMDEIDHRNTPIDWLAKKQYRLYSGKVIQVRPGV